MESVPFIQLGRFLQARIPSAHSVSNNPTPRLPGERQTSGAIRSLPTNNLNRSSTIRSNRHVRETTNEGASRDVDGMSLSEREMTVRSDIKLLTTWNIDLW